MQNKMKIKIKSRLKVNKMKLKIFKQTRPAKEERETNEERIEENNVKTGFMRKWRNEKGINRNHMRQKCYPHRQNHQCRPHHNYRHHLYHCNSECYWWWLFTMMIFVNAIIVIECSISSSNITTTTRRTATFNKHESHDPIIKETNASVQSQAAQVQRQVPLTNDTIYTQIKPNATMAAAAASTTTTTTKTTTIKTRQHYKSSNTTHKQHNAADGRNGDSIFINFVRQFPSGNELWDGIIRDCYHKTSFSCLQKNVYTYLNDVLESQDLNVTQRFKFYHNRNVYTENQPITENDDNFHWRTTETTAFKNYPDDNVISNEINYDNASNDNKNYKYHSNERYFEGDQLPAVTPIEEVTNALYGKSVKFALTHDVELQLPEIMFDGATFRISPRSIEGNGLIAKLELIPKQQIEARLAGKILFKKIQQFLKSKVLLAVLALILIIKIIKVKLFWLLPIIIGVSAAKKLLLKFLLFLFPALSHLFKLCSYYQQTYHHTTKYHHHHHLIDHHHTVVPPWHSTEHNSIPEVIYTHPSKGHASPYLHGAPIHEFHKYPLHEPYESSWQNSGPGLGSEYINDINRIAQIDENSGYFQPHSNNDANELHDWGLGTTQAYNKEQPQPQLKAQQQQQLQNTLTQKRRQSVSAVLHKPPSSLPSSSPSSLSAQSAHSAQSLPQNYRKSQITSQTFNPFIQTDIQLNKSSLYHSNNNNNKNINNNKHKTVIKGSHSIISPVYVSPGRQKQQKHHKPYLQGNDAAPPIITVSGQVADAQYDTVLGQQNLTPEMQAQLKEALRIQNEQRIIQQQQKILEKQPFAMDGQPLMPLNYDPFYSPILLKIDQIIEPLGITDDLCKERLVCSMYKDPNRYSPHSNFISVELSRDANELPTVANANAAMTRFFRLIQAARDGQDQKNCLILYPNCNVNTE